MVVAVRPPGRNRATITSGPPWRSNSRCAQSRLRFPFSPRVIQRRAQSSAEWPIAYARLSPANAPTAAMTITQPSSIEPLAARIPPVSSAVSLGSRGRMASNVQEARISGYAHQEWPSASSRESNTRAHPKQRRLSGGQPHAGERLRLAAADCYVMLGRRAVEQVDQRRLVADQLAVLRAEREYLIALGQQLAEDALAFGGIVGVFRVEVGRRVPAGAGDRRPGFAHGAEQRGDDGDEEDTDDHAQRQVGADLDEGHRLAVVDERDVVLVQGMQDQLDADETEDRREPVGEVDETVQQALDEEVQLPQAEQRERRRGEDDVDVLGETEDRRDRVEREKHVRAADGDHHQQHGRHGAPAVHHGEQLVAVIVLGGMQDLLRHPDDDVVGPAGLLGVVRPQDAAGGNQQDQPEQVEDPREGVDQRGTEKDEAGASDEGEDDPEQQHLLLVLARDPEAGHDYQEDEQVVDRQRLFGDVPGEILRALLIASPHE